VNYTVGITGGVTVYPETGPLGPQQECTGLGLCNLTFFPGQVIRPSSPKTILPPLIFVRRVVGPGP